MYILVFFIIMILSMTFFSIRNYYSYDFFSRDILDETIKYFKIIVSIFNWLIVAILFRNYHKARILIGVIILGTSVDALFKIFGNVFGLWIVDGYEHSGVTASFGAEGISGKGTVAFLVLSLFLSWYYFKRKPFRGGIVSIIFLFAIIMTNDRSAQVALILSFIWCFTWLFISKKRKVFYKILMWFMVILLPLGFIYLKINGTHSLLARWEYELSNKGKLTGSGRVDFYSSAWSWFKSAPIPEFLFGQGYQKTYDMIEKNTGMRVHTHSDFFDLMSVGGVLGITIYILYITIVISIIYVIPHNYFEYQIGFAIIISFFVMSVLTGQLGAVHSMSVLGSSLWCLRIIGLSKNKNTNNENNKMSFLHNGALFWSR